MTVTQAAATVTRDCGQPASELEYLIFCASNFPAAAAQKSSSLNHRDWPLDDHHDEMNLRPGSESDSEPLKFAVPGPRRRAQGSPSLRLALAARH